MHSAQRDRIRRLRVHGSADGSRRCRAQLEAGELHPPSLPRSAILILQELRVTPPRSPVWTQQVRQRVDEAARGAAWPAREPVGAGCKAVAFADEAELLACLALDGLGQRFGERWWWPLWLGGAPCDLRGVARAWLQAPRAVPAALRLLEMRAQAQALLRRLLPAEAQTIGTAVARAYGVSEPACEPSGGAQVHGADTATDDSPSPADAASPQASSRRRAEPPLPEGREPQALLRWTLWQLAAAAKDDLRAAHPEATRDAMPGGMSRASPAPPGSAAPSLADIGAPPSLRDVASTIAGPAGDRPASVSAAEALPVAVASSRAPAIGAGPRGVPPLALSSVAAVGAGPAPMVSAAAMPPLTTTVAEAAPPPGVGPAFVSSVAERRASVPAVAPALPSSLRRCVSEFGGLLYLLNVLQALDLYGDFTQPRHDSLALSPWALLALLARRWFGVEALQADPLWPLLLELAGCEAARDLGDGFTPPPWQVPDGWLRAFPDVTRDPPPRRRGRRLQADAGGFCLRDGPLEAATVDTPQAARRRWLMQLSRYLLARLARALGVRTPAEVRTQLVRQSARVELSATELRLHFSLAALPLAIRYAGLDRDIGWMPAAGLAIHFEYL
ncbi:hypothetical protein [Solimonas soli]|uniref:hypothetical protein n=1 Tax=Solimonas soli TaxID=413479 RepID=UPI000480C5D0|nr:hypothetical protein [Solimonas soli]